MVKKNAYTPKQRNTRKRRMKKILLVSVEGNRNNKTEKLYLEHFKGKSLEIRFVPGNETDPKCLMQRLADAVEELEKGDMAVCLIDSDFDSARNSAIRATEEMIPRKDGVPVYLIVSAPSFEMWYLCHFAYSTRQYQNSEELMKELSRYIPEYEKSKDVYDDCLKGKEATAIQNAQKLEAYCKGNGWRPHTVEYMPSTEMYKVMEWIKKII
jgi:hypothetical protein